MSKLVLAVDDDELVLEVLSDMLEDLGCEVVRARAPSQALQYVQDNDRIHSIITDVDMGMIDGYELIDRARDIRPDIEAIVISGRAHDRDDILYLPKPFSEDQLEVAMSKTMGNC
jgi:CheY-like chemotaxis protein